MGRSLALALCVALILPPGLAVAAGPERQRVPEPGDRLRVTTSSSAPRPLVGTLIEITERDLVLALSPSEHRVIPRSELTRLESSLGRRRHTTQGLLIGATSGATVVAVGSCGGGTCTSFDVLTYAAFGALGGALLGGALGGLIQTETRPDLPASQPPPHGNAGPWPRRCPGAQLGVVNAQANPLGCAIPSTACAAPRSKRARGASRANRSSMLPRR